MVNYKYFITITIIMSLLMLSGCSSGDNTDKFIEFVRNDISITKDKDGMIELPSGHLIDAEIFYASLEKEKSTYNPKVISAMTSSMDGKWYLNLDDIKKDMRYLGELVIQYAEKKEWENNYYLYTKVSPPYAFASLVYDYEADTLYVPNRYEDYAMLYKNFQTFNIPEISQTDEGVKCLVDKGIGKMVHNKFEVNIDWLKGYNVYISDGDFKDYGREDSFRH